MQTRGGEVGKGVLHKLNKNKHKKWCLPLGPVNFVQKALTPRTFGKNMSYPQALPYFETLFLYGLDLGKTF
jgi:hypothetical protein